MPPTPDPFASVARQSDDAYAQGMQLFQEGRYREANDAFNRARLLAPTDDPRIDDMLRQTSAILTPTATPVPPTPVPTASPTPLAQSSATPAADLADAYFGQVFLCIVPGGNTAAVPMAQFSVQDQLGLYVEKLEERLHLGFSLRVFDADSGALVTNITGDRMQRFSGKFVWYHEGTEPVGHFRAELYAGEVLTNVFEYVVGTEPVAVPTVVPTVVPSVVPSVVPNGVPAEVPPAAQLPRSAPAPQPAAAGPQPPAPPRPATPAPVVLVAPTPRPAPLPQAVTVTVAAGPSALAVVDGSDQLYVADRSGLIWLLEGGQPSLRQPFRVAGEPVGLAADPTNAKLYVATRGDHPAVLTLDTSTGATLATLDLPSNPGDVALNGQRLYVVLPDQDALASVDVGNGSVVNITPGLAHVTGMALDTARNTVFVTQLEGDLSAIDLQSGAISATAHVTDIGLAGLAIGGDLLYAINTPGQQLVSVDWTNRSAQSSPLDLQPAALAFGDSTIYVLDGSGTGVERLASADASDQGTIRLTDAGQPVSLNPGTLWQRPRLATNPLDASVYVIQPDAALLAIAAP